jgi:hypothetical protein
MPCPPPSPPHVPPTLRQLLEHLAQIDAAEAVRHREAVRTMEERLARAEDQLAREEAALAAVVVDGSQASRDAWCTRSRATSDARRARRMLSLDEALLRETLELYVFLARQAQAFREAAARR